MKGCDASLTRVLLNAASQVIDVGRETSRWTVAAYKAAEATFDGCVFPVADGRTCGRPLGWCHLHHVKWWRHGGRTDVANGAPLCRHHHTVVHHHGWDLTYDHSAGLVTATRRDDGRTRTAPAHRGPADRASAGSADGDPPEPDQLPL